MNAKLKNIRKAQRIAERVFTELLPILKPGITERQVANAITVLAKEHGADRLAFPSIVGSGPNGAKPHAIPGRRKLAKGDLVVLDFGMVIGGYHSDMTRTIAIGQPSAEQRKVYEVVRQAQEAAIASARVGMTGRELDAVARDLITEAGFGSRFVHALGHGVGRNIHQAPRLRPKRGGEILKAGTVVTIEPGIYLPGKFGVRIEDMVLLKARGSENLTSVPTALLKL